MINSPENFDSKNLICSMYILIFQILMYVCNYLIKSKYWNSGNSNILVVIFYIEMTRKVYFFMNEMFERPFNFKSKSQV